MGFFFLFFWGNLFKLILGEKSVRDFRDFSKLTLQGDYGHLNTLLLSIKC